MHKYNGPERRDLSECPLTAQQAYNMLNLLDKSIKQNQQMLEKQDKITGFRRERSILDVPLKPRS